MHELPNSIFLVSVMKVGSQLWPSTGSGAAAAGKARFPSARRRTPVSMAVLHVDRILCFLKSSG
jgi:hypothetical protein